MASTEQVSQGGVTVVAEPVDQSLQVSQGGVTVAAANTKQPLQVSQAGVTVVYRIPEYGPRAWVL